MLAETEVSEYLDEIREQVCSRCPERPPGGPPCLPLGKNCGVELHLPQLIDSIRHVHSPLITPYLDRNRHEICENCAFLHSSICPCPMDYLAVLLVEAVEEVDRRRQEENRPATNGACAPSKRGDWAAEISDAFEQAVGTWTGCDWPTSVGKSGLDLNGWTAAAAADMAAKRAGTPEAEDWAAAATWLARVEEHARRAQTEAARAVVAAHIGDWEKAVNHGRTAWAQEFATGRALRRGLPLAWQRLCLAVEAAFDAHEDAVRANP